MLAMLGTVGIHVCWPCFPCVSCLSHGFVYHHGLACLPWVSQIHATLTLAHCPAPAGMPKKKDESPDQRDFKKEAKKFVKTLMEESDPKALLLQDVREAVQKELLKGEEPKHVAMFNAIVDSTVSHFHRKEREVASSSKPKGVLKPIFKK